MSSEFTDKSIAYLRKKLKVIANSLWNAEGKTG